MRHFSILAAAVLLSGCGIPPVVAIASYAVDGALLATTGKTSKDHALSLAMQQDCNMLRIVVGDQICHDYEPTDRARWALAAMPANEEHLVTVRDGRVIRVAANPDAGEPMADGVVVATTGPVLLPAAPLAASLD